MSTPADIYKRKMREEAARIRKIQSTYFDIRETLGGELSTAEKKAALEAS